MKPHFSLSVASLLLVLPTAVPGQTTFTKITTGPVVTDGGFSDSGAWGDFDTDGDLDLFVCHGQPGPGGGQPANNSLYRNDGNGQFTAVSSGPVVTGAKVSISGAWGDYNNDGHLDLFVARPLQQGSSLYRNSGNGVFTQITTGPIPNSGGESITGAWGDYDNDGHLDLVVPNLQSRTFVFHNNGNETFTRILQGTLATNVTSIQSASWADYDNDGDLDFFITDDSFNQPRPNSLYRNDGNGNFTLIRIVAETAPHVVGVWGDYDNDADLDLFVTVYRRRNLLFQNNGNGTFTKVTSGEIVSEIGEWTGAAWGDYDNNGFLDLFVCNGFESGANNRLWRNNGNGTFARVTDGVIVNDGGHSAGCDWGDYDNDGFLDLFVTNAARENNFLYRNDGNSNSWLKLKLVGTVSNRAAIGAKIRIKTVLNGVPFWQLREITTGSGHGGNNLIPHFGLSSASVIDTVRIEWPSGTVQEFRDVAAKQFLTVTEPPRLSVAVSNGQIQLLLKGGIGFAYGVQASSNLVEWNSVTNIVTTNMVMPVVALDAAPLPQQFFRAVRQ